MSLRRLLVISPHFPPDSSAGTHRVRLLAPHLRAHGWEAVVLTASESAYEGRLDPDLASLVPASLRVVRCGAMPPRVSRAAGFGDLGLRVLPGLALTAHRLLASEPYDGVFITIYPTYPALLGPLLKRRFGVPFILDYQDPWVGAWGRDVAGGINGSVDLKSRATRALAGAIEPRVLRSADGVTAVSARTYEDAIARTGAHPRAVAEIPIGWDAGDAEALARRPPRAPVVPTDAYVNLCYVGTILPLGIGALRALLQAVRQLVDREPEIGRRLRLHFFGTSNQTAGGPERVMPHARDLGVADRVREQPARLDYLDALDVLRQASGLLLLGSSEPHYTPSKAFPALLASRPMLAVYHAASSIVPIFTAAAPPPAGCLVAFSDDRPVEGMVDDIARALTAVARAADGPVRVDLKALEPWSAPVLAGRLAEVCNAVSGGRAHG